MRNIIIIPARSGSKRLKNKNLLKLENKTLVERTIIFSQKVKDVDKIIVSSDHKDILKYQKKFQNITFIKRPQKLSSSKSLLIDTVKHLYKLSKKDFKNVLILQPTSPFRSISLINNKWKKFIKLKKKYKSIVSISKETISNKRKFFIKSGVLVQKKNEKNNSYEANGNFFMVNMEFLMKFKKFVKSGYSIGSIIHKNKYIIDIDTKKDYNLALRFK